MAISGDVETISQFPGLQWLAQPTNDIDTFAAELRQSLPNIVLSIGRPSRWHVKDDINAFISELRRSLPNIVLCVGKANRWHVQANSWF